MKRIVAGAAAALALTLAGCTHLNGTVESKDYTPAHTDMVMQAHYHQQCISVPYTTTSSTGTTVTSTRQQCSQVYDGTYPTPVYYPACWELTVRNDEDSKMHSKCVDRGDYHSVQVGEHYEEQ